MRVGHDVPLRPSPDRKVLPGSVEHAMRIHDRLGFQAGRELPLRRFGGVFSRTPSELLGLDWPAYHRIAFGVRAETPHGVVAIRPTWERPAVRREPPRVNRMRTR